MVQSEDESPSEKLKRVAELLAHSARVVVLTGAGISAESGIPTFRDALRGLWAEFDPQALATPEAFRRDKALVWGWYEWRRMVVLRSRPNPGHLALAGLTEFIQELTLLTQNVDDLHERAGSTGVWHLHGSLHQPRCFRCSAPFPLPPGLPEEPEGGRRLPPPVCPQCGGDIRPGVVWFGEGLPADAWQAAKTAVHSCDALMSIGTSGLVYPAAGLAELASRQGKPVIVINPEPTEQDRFARHVLRGLSGRLLPELLARMQQARGSFPHQTVPKP